MRCWGKRIRCAGASCSARGAGTIWVFQRRILLLRRKRLLPKDGVYAIVGRHGGRDYPGLVSIGDKPTFGGGEKAIEAWLLDFQETIYGEELSLRDFRFIREQRRFAGVEELFPDARGCDARALSVVRISKNKGRRRLSPAAYLTRCC